LEPFLRQTKEGKWPKTLEKNRGENKGEKINKNPFATGKKPFNASSNWTGSRSALAVLAIDISPSV
jgi:hypothetical protein